MPSLIARLPRPLRLTLKRLAHTSPSRDRWQQPDRVVAAVGAGPGMRIADLGSGFGYFTFRFADAVGPAGVVYAIDTDADLRAEIAARASREGRTNVCSIEAGEADLGLPEPVDLLFLANVYHHLADQRSYFARAATALCPGGRVAILETRPIWASRIVGHATPPERVAATLEAAGFRRTASHDFLRDQSLQVFARAAPDSQVAPTEPSGAPRALGG